MPIISNTAQNILLFLVLIIGIAFACLQQFVLTLPDTNSEFTRPIGGLVVATGGQARIQKGVELLAEGKANRMLISGVGQGISKELLSENLYLNKTQKTFFDCCVEIEFTAIDTNGNAKATLSWMQKHNLNEILLVSANYHLPRAEIIFRKHLPENSVFIHTVNPPDLKLTRWYMSWQTTRLLLKEYLKYLYVRIGLG